MARQLVYVLNAIDNVGTALVDLQSGLEVETGAGDGPRVRVTLQVPIAFGHKVALAHIARGAEVRKYGEVIGLATDDIAPGQHVHVHNVESQRGRGDLTGVPRS